MPAPAIIINFIIVKKFYYGPYDEQVIVDKKAKERIGKT